MVTKYIILNFRAFLCQGIFGVDSENLCQRNCVEDLKCSNYTYILTSEVNCLLFQSCNTVITCKDCTSGSPFSHQRERNGTHVVFELIFHKKVDLWTFFVRETSIYSSQKLEVLGLKV